MPTSAGPNTALDSNIIFSYDVGDTLNSYRGEPTVNYWDGVQYSVYNQDATNYRNQATPLPPTPGYEVVKVVSNTPGSYGHSILWKAPYPNNNVATITNSIYAWLESGTYVQVGQHWFPWYYGTQKYIPAGQWVRISETYAINEGNSYGVAALTYSTDGVAYFTMPQYEYKSHITPYIGASQTRSSTQGLLPLISNTTINLSNISFTSNAQITYDGTDDYIDLGNLGTIGTTYSIECVFNSSNVVNYRNVFDMNYATYPGVTGNVGPRLEQYSDGTITIIWSGVTNNNSIAVNTPVIPISANTNYHMVFTQDGNKGLIYLNGAYKSQNSNTYGYVQTFGDANLGRGFELAGDRYYAGSLPLFKIYNVALSAEQIKQNYNQYKTRFNLS
jgi:hypothetical protein